MNEPNHLLDILEGECMCGSPAFVPMYTRYKATLPQVFLQCLKLTVPNSMKEQKV